MNNLKNSLCLAPAYEFIELILCLFYSLLLQLSNFDTISKNGRNTIDVSAIVELVFAYGFLQRICFHNNVCVEVRCPKITNVLH
jgi:hypothetical protein